MSRLSPLCLSLFLLVTAACSDDAAPLSDSGLLDQGVADQGVVGEAGQDGAPGDLGADGGEIPLTLSKGGDGHKDVSATLAAGQVRAGKVTAKSQLLPGVKVEGQVGDFKIYNNRIAVIIQNKRVSDNWAPWGGEILDAQLLGQSGQSGDSLLGELIFAAGVRIMDPVSVGVVADGSDGKAAIVRAIGKPRVVPYLGAVLGDNFGADVDAHIVFDYVLEPDKNDLEIRWRLINRYPRKQELPMAIYAFSAGDGAEFFGTDVGFNPPNFGRFDFVGMIARGVGYAVVSPKEKLIGLVEQSGVWVLSGETATLPASGEFTRTLHLVVTRGTPEAVRTEVRKLLGQSEPPTLSGTVKDPSGKAIAGARVHLRKDDTSKSYVTMETSDSAGKYTVKVPAGDYLVSAAADGRRMTGESKVTVGASGGTADIAMEGQGTISFSVKDDAGAAIPAKLVFLPGKSIPTPAAVFGEKSHPHGSALVVYSPSGSGSAALPAGSYTVHVSRGFEYEVDKATVTLADGASESKSFVIRRSVDTTGYMCGDFHLHAMYSPDSSDLNEFKVSTLAASGVELPVATDHEYIADYTPAIAKLGLQKWLYGIVGEELTTLVYGHFNPFPIIQDPSKPNKGAYLWHHQDPATMFAGVRSLWPNAVMQVNHPRSGSAIGGYFNYVGYNPLTGKADVKPKEWSRNFDAFEVTNGSSWDSNLKKTVQDWFSFLDRGFLVTGTGNSDSHHAYKSQVGYPRNYVKLSTDEPAKLVLSEFAKAVKEQKLLISGGPFMEVSVGGKGMGEVAPLSGGKAELKIKVQAPTWMKVDTLRIYTEGGKETRITVDSSTADPSNAVVRYNDTVTLTPTGTSDTWVIVVASGSGSLAPVSNGTPFAASNPIYLDVNGNGVYDAPKTF